MGIYGLDSKRKRRAADEVHPEEQAPKRQTLRKDECSGEAFELLHEVLEQTRDESEELKAKVAKLEKIIEEANKPNFFNPLQSYREESYHKAKSALNVNIAEITQLKKEKEVYECWEVTTQGMLCGYQKRLKNAGLDIARLNTDLEKMAEEADTNTGKIRRLEAELKKIKSDNQKEADDANEQLKREVQTARNAAAAAEEKAASMQQRVAELKREKLESEKNNNTTVQKQASRIATLEEKNGQLEAQSAELEAQSAQLSSTQEELKTSQDEVKILEQRVDFIMTEGRKMEADYTSLKSSVASSASTGSTAPTTPITHFGENPAILLANSEAMDPSPDSVTQRSLSSGYTPTVSSGADFLGIDMLPWTEFVMPCQLGENLIDVIANCIKQGEACYLPRDIGKSMLATDKNTTYFLVSPRYKNGETISLLLEVGPENFHNLTADLLLPYRDPRNPHVEPDASFVEDYVFMCLLTQLPEVKIEAAMKSGVFGTYAEDKRIKEFCEKMLRDYGNTHDPTQRMPFPNNIRQRFLALWEEAVFRLTVMREFRAAVRLIQSGHDFEHLFERWAPKVLRGLPQDKAVYEITPAAPIGGPHDGLDETLPDVDTSMLTGMEVLRQRDEENARISAALQRELADLASAPPQHAPRTPKALCGGGAAAVAPYDGDNEHTDDQLDFDGVLNTTERPQPQKKQGNQNHYDRDRAHAAAQRQMQKRPAQGSRYIHGQLNPNYARDGRAFSPGPRQCSGNIINNNNNNNNHNQAGRTNHHRKDDNTKDVLKTIQEAIRAAGNSGQKKKNLGGPRAGNGGGRRNNNKKSNGAVTHGKVPLPRPRFQDPRSRDGHGRQF